MISLFSLIFFLCRRPAFVDLKQLGIPLLLVDQWTDLNASFLETTYAAEFQHVNWEKVKYMISPLGTMARLLQWNATTIPIQSKSRMSITKKVMHYYLSNKKNMH